MSKVVVDEMDEVDDYGSPDGDAPMDATEKAVAATAIGAAKAKQPETKCFRVGHPMFGTMRCFVATESEAVAQFIDKRCPLKRDTDRIKTQLEIDEIPFRPAEGQPNTGWRKPLTQRELQELKNGAKKLTKKKPMKSKGAY